MQRFFVDLGSINDRTVSLEGETAHRIINVLRLCSGDKVVLVDGGGHEHVTTLVTFTGGKIIGKIESVSPSIPEPNTHITLYQSMVKADKFEWVLQKGTEIGITEFVPIISNRTISRSSVMTSVRYKRWMRVVIHAAEQSRRGKIPQIHEIMSLDDALARASDRGNSFMMWESETLKFLRGLEESIGDHVNLFVGPEGGFNKDEVDLAVRHGVHTISLGDRVLRSETAGIISAALVLFMRNDFG